MSARVIGRIKLALITSLLERVEALLEAAGVRTLGAREGLEPLGDLLEAFLAGGLREARVHLRVLVGLAGDRRLEVERGVAQRLAGRGIADLLEVVEVTVRVAGLALGGVAEQARDVRLTPDVRDLCEGEVAAGWRARAPPGRPPGWGGCASPQGRPCV